MDRMHRHMILRRRSWRHTRATLSLHEVATECGLHPELVERFVALGIIDPIENHPNHFTPDATLRIQRLLRLRRDLGVNYNAAGLILELLERIDALEAHLRQYESG
jgi:DNA-binding transcriptional MerR regulator